MMTADWIAERTKAFNSSGIRKVFDLAAKLKDPVNLSIGQPDFDVPPAVKDAMIQAIQDGKNGYALTQGMPVLANKIQSQVDEQFGHSDRKSFVCSGTSGGLVLALMALVNRGDEVIFFDPYFVMYESLVRLVDGVPKPISTYPDFEIDLQRVVDEISDRTKVIIVNSPANPTGVCLEPDQLEQLAAIAADRGICLISDEIYNHFCYDEPHVSPATYNPETLVIEGFSKSYAMTGWRVGYAHGPAEIIDTMIKLQQFTFVCAPQPAQWASAAAMDIDLKPYVDAYRVKRDMLYEGLKDHYEIVKPGGAFYLFPKLPWGTGQAFIERAVDNNLLVIPGNIFSQHDTHFRISYAASNEKLQRGIEILQKIARP